MLTWSFFSLNKNNSKSRISFNLNKMQYFPSAFDIALKSDFDAAIDLYAFSIYHVAVFFFFLFSEIWFIDFICGDHQGNGMKRLYFSYFLVDEHNVCLMFAYLWAADLNAAHNLQTYNCLLKIILTSDDVLVLEKFSLAHEPCKNSSICKSRK